MVLQYHIITLQHTDKFVKFTKICAKTLGSGIIIGSLHTLILEDRQYVTS